MSFLRSLIKPAPLRTTLRVRQPVTSIASQSRQWQLNLNNAPRVAQYSSAGGLSKEEVEARVLDVFKGFEKVDPKKVSTSNGSIFDFETVYSYASPSIG
jgi:hypothetical protein